MSSIVQRMLSSDSDTILTSLTEKEFDQLFNDDEFSPQLCNAKTEDDVKSICNEFKLIRLLEGNS